MIVHRIATRDLRTEGFLSNFIDYLVLRTKPVARVIDKPLLINGDAMEERNASFAGYSYVCWRKPADAHVEWIIASDQHVKSVLKNLHDRQGIIVNIGSAPAGVHV